MNEETGAKEFAANDPKLSISNATPNYIHTLGDYPNELGPAYQSVPMQDWFYPFPRILVIFCGGSQLRDLL